MSINDWGLLYRTRLDILPVRGYRWSDSSTKTCRRCKSDIENAPHITNRCKSGLVLSTQRHDSILALLAQLLTEKGFLVTINRACPDLHGPSENSLRPDILTSICNRQVVLDVVVAYDTPHSLEAAYCRKVEKYLSTNIDVLPLVLGALGSWLPSNDDIRARFGIGARRWDVFRRLSRKAAISGSIETVRVHLREIRLDSGLDVEVDDEFDEAALEPVSTVMLEI